MGDSPAPVVFGACCIIWLICSCFLLGYSFDTLEPNRMGLLYNENTLYLQSDTLYNAEQGDSGRWFTGLGQSFIEFPRQLQQVKFNSEVDADGGTISARTFNGSTVWLDMAFQFGLVKDPQEVFDLYMTYGSEYKRFFVKYARAIVRDVVSDHIVFDLWEQREAMGTAMRDALHAQLTQRHAFVAGFQVLSLTIPQEIQDAIESTTVAAQKIGEAKFEKDAETVRALTRRLVAEKTSEVTVLQAEANAGALIRDVQAKATALNVTVQSETDVLIDVKNKYGFSNTQLLRYMWLDAVTDLKSDNVKLSVSQPSDTQIS